MPRSTDFAVMGASEIGEQVKGRLIEIEDVLLRRRRGNARRRRQESFPECGE